MRLMIREFAFGFAFDRFGVHAVNLVQPVRQA